MGGGPWLLSSGKDAHRGAKTHRIQPRNHQAPRKDLNQKISKNETLLHMATNTTEGSKPGAQSEQQEAHERTADDKKQFQVSW